MKKAKSVLCVVMSVLMIIACVPAAFSASGEAEFTTSDNECYSGEKFFYIDDSTGVCFSGDAEGGEHDYYTSYAVGQIAYYDGFLYASHDGIIERIDTANAEKETFFTAGAKISRFAFSPDGLYVLVSGSLFLRAPKTGALSCVTDETGITDFWLDGVHDVSYMIDDELIYTLDTETGIVSSKVNMASEYVGNIYVLSGNSGDGKGSNSADAVGITTLQSKFPAGKYWNHVGSSLNNPNGYTSSPCTHHSGGCSYSGSCGCNSFSSAIQCMGYAYKCGYDTSDSYPRNWNKYTSSSSVDSVKAGDVIRYRYDGHSIFVIGVSGNTVTYTDCNSDGHCIIRWYATVSKSTLKSSFTNLRVNPAAVTPVSGDPTEIKYTVAFDANTGTCSQASASVVSGSTLGELPVPEKTGYNFMGWYTSPTGGTQVTPSTRVTGNMTVYAHWEIIVYTIDYNGNGNGDTVNNVPASQTKKYGETIILNLKTPTRTGYTYKGWTADINGAGTVYNNANNRYSVNENATLYAQWAGNMYMVSFNANGGSCSVSTKSVTNGSAYGSLPLPTRSGYSFQGWYTKSSGGERITETTTVRTSSGITLYAQWDNQRCTVDYDANGGSGAPASQTKNYGSAIVLSSTVPVKSGYQFLVWNTSSDGSGDSYNPGDIYSQNDSIVLYAIWSGEKYTVRFDPNGGSGGPQSQIKIQDVALTLSSESPVNSGFTLASWNTKKDGSGQAYLPGGKYTQNSDITLYAQWEKTTYTVTYDLNGAEGANAAYEKNPDESIAIIDTEPSREGFDFAGWNTQPDGSGETYTAGQIYSENASLYLYADWIRHEFAVDYYASGGTGAPDSQIKYYDLPLTISSQVPSRPGYVFEYWTTSSGGTGTVYGAGDTYTENRALKLYAHWTARSFSVTYNPAGGTVSTAGQTFVYGEKYFGMPVPERTGYTFAGWYITPDRAVENGDTVRITSDSVFTAHWTADTYILTLDAGEGNCSAESVKITYDSPLGELPPAERDGYIFAGWFDSPEGGSELMPGTVVMTTSGYTAYARWIPTNVTVVFDPAGGTCSEVSRTLEYGEPYGELPVPVRKGYEFSGWIDGNGNTAAGQDVPVNDSAVILTASWTPSEYTVHFDCLQETVPVQYGKEYGVLPGAEKEDSVFCGWYDSGGNRITGDTVFEYENDITLTARFASVPAEPMTVKFVADGVTVSEIVFTDTYEIDEPEVINKEGYSGSWEKYDLSQGSCVVQAVYVPEEYTLDWGTGSRKYKYGEAVETPEIDVPEGYILSGFTPSLPGTMPEENLEITPVLTSVEYTAYFVADGKLAGSVQYTVLDESIEEPAVPSKTGYESEWEEYTLTPGGITVYARRTAVGYTASFIADGRTVETVAFTVESGHIQEPDVPQKTGYSGEWENYALSAGNINVNAVYTPRKYTATFVIDGEIVEKVVYSYGVKSIKEPKIPQKEGYSAAWSEYVLGAADFTSVAIYQPVTYIATFVAEGKTVAQIPFTVEDEYIPAPKVPYSLNGDGVWEDFGVTASDITVNAIYQTVTVFINGFTQKRSIPYRATITFSASASKPVNGASIHWFIDGVDMSDLSGSVSYTVTQARKSFTVQAKYMSGGNVIAQSDIENVSVDSSFFARLSAFFKGLFGSLPVIYQ